MWYQSLFAPSLSSRLLRILPKYLIFWTVYCSFWQFRLPRSLACFDIQVNEAIQVILLSHWLHFAQVATKFVQQFIVTFCSAPMLFSTVAVNNTPFVRTCFNGMWCCCIMPKSYRNFFCLCVIRTFVTCRAAVILVSDLSQAPKWFSFLNATHHEYFMKVSVSEMPR